MSNLTLLEKSKSLIEAQAAEFVKLAKSHKAVNFEQEAHFAMQALRANDFLAGVAAKNPESLIAAVHNIASVGLSLNPALKHAYLVPRKGKVCLDFGYKGLVHLAVDSGGILYAQPELVYKKDKFKRRGRNVEPLHEYESFDEERGPVVGVYCVAELPNDKFLTETMTIKEVLEIRDRTESYKAVVAGTSKSCPWTTDEGEMTKKTVIRRGSKSWPMKNAGRFEKALQLQDEIDPIDVSPISVQATPQIEGTNPQTQEIRDLLKALNKEEAGFIGYVSTVNNRKIEKIEDMSKKEMENALIQLYSWSSAAQKKEDETDENA